MGVVDTPCIPWHKHVRADDYGLAWDGRSMRMAHRVLWERERGPIPAGMDLDHLCSLRSCVNLDHLEVTTHRENVRRAWERHPAPLVGRCGHALKRQTTDGHRYCPTCNAQRAKARHTACRGCGGPFDRVDVTGRRACSACLRLKGKRMATARWGKRD